MAVSRAERGWAAALLALGVGLCFVPLLNLLAFEFAFVIGIAATFAAGGLGVRAARATPEAPWRAWAHAGLRSTALLAVPLAPITLNALRVRNCDYLEGLVFYALLPGVTVWVASGWGVAAGRLTRRARLVFALLVLATLARSLARFWLAPPVDAFHPVFGYYPGAIYDEFIPLGARLVASRLEDLTAALALVALSTLPRRRLLPALALAAAVGGHLLARAADIHRDAAHIQARLGGHTATAHLDLFHPASWPADRVRDLATDLEFAFAELTEFFGVAPQRAAIYLYPDRATKKRLMGAGRTRVAKPWQRAMHVHDAQVGQTVLIHELAHVFSAEIAEGPHHLSLHRGLVPHMPLIEGVAEAATWPTERLDLHDWSAAMTRVGVAPPLPAVLAPSGFYLRNSRTAYTLCGSFVRFYREAHGREAVNTAYRDGAFPDATFEPTWRAWSAMIAARPLDPRALADARARFDRPAIFGKVCAHEIAALRAEADDHTARGDLRAALASQRAILGHVAGDLSARLTQVRLLHALGDDAGARAAAQQLADDPQAGAIARRVAAEWLADLDALAGRLDAARDAYTAALTAAFSRADLRRLAVKRAATDHPAGPAALELLISPVGDDAALQARYDRLSAEGADWGVARYLLSRRAANPPAETLAHLAAAQRLGLPTARLRFEAERQRAHSIFREGDHAGAAAAFTALADRDDLELTGAERQGLHRWARRAAFFAQRRATVDKIGPHLENPAPRLWE